MKLTVKASSSAASSGRLKNKDKTNTNAVNKATGVLDLFININNSSYNIATGVMILTAGVIYPSFFKGSASL